MFTKDEVNKPEKPTSPEQPAAPKKPSKPVKPNHKVTKKLPQTGEMNTALFTVLGIVLLGTLTNAYVLKRKITD